MKNFPAITKETLPAYFNTPEIVRQVVEQIRKDFDMDIVIVLTEGEDVYQKLLDLIEPFIAKLIDNSYQRLLQLLYRIDINEKAIADIVSNSEKNTLSAEITRLIIMRELQKVVIRNYYK